MPSNFFQSVDSSEECLLFWPAPLPHQKNVIEIADRLPGPNRCDYAYDFGVLNRTISTVYDSVDELFGHNRSPLLEPALQRPQLFGPDGVGVITHERFQDLHAAGVGVILQVGKYLGPDML